MREVVTVIYGQGIRKRSIARLPFLKGIDVWDLNNRSGEIVECIKKASEGNVIDGEHIRPSFFNGKKNILFKELKPSSNYYIMPKGTNEIVIVRITRVEDECDWEIVKDLRLNIEIVKKHEKKVK